MTQHASRDLKLIQDYPRPPVKRAAYGDRAAWLMAILSELAYTRLDQDDNNCILALAKELAQLSDHEQIVDRLQNLAKLLRAAHDGATTTDNELLRSALAAGDFRLKGVLFDAGTDTQGYVAVRRPKDGPGMAVLVFRGTQQRKDWITNLNVAMSPVTGSNGECWAMYIGGFTRLFALLTIRSARSSRGMKTCRSSSPVIRWVGLSQRSQLGTLREIASRRATRSVRRVSEILS